MRRVVLVAILVGLGGLVWYRQGLPIPPAVSNVLPERVQTFVDATRQKLLGSAAATRTSSTADSKPAPPKFISVADSAPAATHVPSERDVTLYLHNGGVISGELVRRDAQGVTIRLEYGDVTFQQAEIKRLVKGWETGDEGIVMPDAVTKAGQWTHQHNPVFRLLNGSIVDARLTRVTDEALHFVQPVGEAGTVELAIPRDQLDQAVFRPIENERSEAIHAMLHELFPKMVAYDEGMFTILTDSPGPSVNDYRRTVREVATDWYLAFYPLTENHQPTVQQYVIIFDDFGAYIEYAATDGVPGWLAPGYFSPEDEVLYAPNFLGERFSELLYEAFLGDFHDARRQWRDTSGVRGSRYEEFVEGTVSEFMQALERAHAKIRHGYWQLSQLILRHEMTHAIFHNWQLQTIVLSKMREQDQEIVQQKKQYLQEQDVQKKRELLEGLLKQEDELSMPEQQADNSWFVEGTAEYLAPSPLGSPDIFRIPDLQEAMRNGQILPLEFLNTFRLGSFPEMTSQARLYAYAQSWAYVRFLMERYPEAFWAYLDRLARERAEPDEDTIEWLLEAIGTDVRSLDAQFAQYITQFPPEDPYWLKQLDIIFDLRNELLDWYRRL